jgi:hypothetical protein
MADLDGKTPVKPTPFDAHEQATRGEHIPTELDSPDKDPKTIVEFPKAVDHVQKADAPEGHLEPVIATSPEHEAELKAAKTAEADETKSA